MTGSKKTHWIIGDKRVDNQLEAYKLALQDTKLESRLCFQEDEFDKINWTQEPSKSWEELCLEHAVRLRQKYKKLKLFFSAGRDSGHIFRVFEQAKIPIDELIIPYSLYSPMRKEEHFNHIMPVAKELCRRNPGMTIREVVQDKHWCEEMYKNSDWMTEKNKVIPLMFTMRKWDEIIKRDPDYDSGNCAYMFGFEKPNIKLIDGVFYSQITSQYLKWAPHDMPGAECFFYSPEIYAKQCWLLINHFEKKYPRCNSEFVENFQLTTASLNYDELCRALGRGDPMSEAVGYGQTRVLNNNHWSMQYILKTAREEKWKSYNEYTHTFNELVKNYSSLIDKETNFFRLDTIDSKKYLIKKQN